MPLTQWKGSAGAANVLDKTVHPGESDSFDRQWSSPLWLESNFFTADQLIRTGAGIIGGYVVSVATATNIIEIRDGVAAGGGSVRFTIPASTAVGMYMWPGGIHCAQGIYLDFTGTGTVALLYV